MTRYSLVTPNRPLGDLLDRRAARSPGVGTNRSASSPPSPVLDRAPSRFIAIASVSCASAEIEPYDIAPVANRLTMLGDRLDLLDRDRRPVRAARRRRGCATVRAVSSAAPTARRRGWCTAEHVVRRLRVACCSRNTVSGLNRWGSPSRRHWYSPPVSSRGAVPAAPAGYAAGVPAGHVLGRDLVEADRRRAATPSRRSTRRRPPGRARPPRRSARRCRRRRWRRPSWTSS